MKTVLAPIDFSPATNSVIREATKLAHNVKGRVVLLHVLQPPIYPPITGYGPVVTDLSHAIANAEEVMARKLSNLEKKARKTFEATDTVLLTGSPASHILDQAKKLRAEYIVMGSHGHTAFYDLFVGSVTRTVMRNSTKPVLVVSSVKNTSKAAPAKKATTSKSKKTAAKKK